MELTFLIIIFVTGIVAGFLNVMAGGGSLLTLPILIFLGLPSATANGTNRIALAVQNTVAILNFKKSGYFNLKFSLMLGIPALIGSIVGASFAVSLSDTIFNKILGVIMMVVLVITLWQPHKKIKVEEENYSTRRKIVLMITFFFIGIYGGFIQAGVGFIIIFALALITGMSLVKINSLKVFVVLLYTFSSLVIFIWNGNIDWGLGLSLAVGNGIGGYLGSKFAITKGDKLIKIVLVVTVSIMSFNLLFPEVFSNLFSALFE